VSLSHFRSSDNRKSIFQEVCQAHIVDLSSKLPNLGKLKAKYFRTPKPAFQTWWRTFYGCRTDIFSTFVTLRVNLVKYIYIKCKRTHLYTHTHTHVFKHFSCHCFFFFFIVISCIIVFSIARSCQVLCYLMCDLLGHALRDSAIQLKEQLDVR